MWRQAVLSVSLPLVLITFAAGLTLLVGTRLAYPGETPDPFAPYEAIMPGQWMVALDDPPCSFETAPGQTLVIECELPTATSPFASVSSSIYSGRFVYTSFSPNDLVVGDVVRHWGRPDVVVKYNHRSFYVFWADQGLVGIIDPVGPVRRFSYMLPIERFTIGLESHNQP